jgi:activating signal cointegrator 1
MRSLTVRHPYAQAIACGLKRIETRSQRTRYRDRLAIHAALGHAPPFAIADHDKVLADYRAAGIDTDAVRASLEEPESWSFGKIIAVAELVDCRAVEDLTPDPAERAFGDYAAGRFGWRLAHVVRLREPVLARGLQGLWPMRPETMDLLEQALSASPKQDLR